MISQTGLSVFLGKLFAGLIVLSMVAKRGTDLTFACVKDCQVCVGSIQKYINTLTITEDDFGKTIFELFKLDYHYFSGNSFVKTYFRSVRSLVMPFMVEWSFVGCQIHKIQLCIKQSSYSSKIVWIKRTAHQGNVNYFYINVCYLHYILPVISETVPVFKPIQSCKLLLSIPNTLTL